MNERDLEIIVDRMKREFKVEANFGPPQVAYRETISRQADVDYTHKKQTGVSGQYARVKLHFEPLAQSAGVVFENQVVGGAGAEGIRAGCREGRARLAREWRTRR